MFTRILVIAAALLLIGVGLPHLLYPLWFDQGAFAACADVIRRGGVMYRDCWEVRGPLMPLLLALPRSLSTAPAALHAFELLWQVLTTLALAALARRMFGNLAALLAAALYWLMFASLNYWASLQAEGFANLFFVLALLSLTSRHRHAPLLAGLCCGLLFWLKYPFVSFAALLFAAPHALSPDPKSKIQNLKSKILLGLVLPIALGLGYFVVNGALADWWLHVQYDIATFHNVPLAYRWEWLTGLFMVEIDAFIRTGNTPTAGWKPTVLQWDLLGRGYPFIFGLMGLGLLRAWRSPVRRAARVALAYLAVGVLLNIWQGHSYRYHFVIWLPAMALLASAAAAPFTENTRTALQRLRLGATLAMAALACIGMIAAMWPWMRDAYDNIIVQGKPLAHSTGESSIADYAHLARFVRDNTGPNDSIFIYSDVPAVYALAERPNAARFPYMRWVDEAGDDEIRERYTAQLLADLQRTRPKFFILSRDGYPWPEAKFIESWKKQKSVNDWVEANYAYSGENGPFLVFARK
ncbi:MAG: glycosyltransferase family 39 protein [Anaerolineae bacterium]|nr:glycosyltransferase family 39 protein [Anaerolineae bacterium]